MEYLVKPLSRNLHGLAILISAILFLVCPDRLAVAQEPFYRLQTSRLICVQENLERYLELPGDELLISVVSCPDIPDNPLLSGAVNEGPDLSFLSDDSPDTLIVVTRAQLKCLAGKSVEERQPIYRFYPQDCRLEPEE